MKPVGPAVGPILPTLTTFASPAQDHARAEREHAFAVARPLAETFTFFEPVGEQRWAEDWQPVFATSADATLHDGSVFTVTSPASSDGPPVSSVWTITRYEPPRAIEYHNVLLGLRATRIAVWCAAAGPDGTCVTVRYVYTGLSAAGDAMIRRITPDSYRQMIAGWGAAIAAYLQRGTPASR